MNPQLPVYNATILYILLVVSLVLIKPDSMYDRENKRFREFGSGRNRTVMSLPVVSISAAILLYLLFSAIETLCAGKQLGP